MARGDFANLYRFHVNHQLKQRLILRALNEMNMTAETSDESAAITEMIIELERLLAMRKRGRAFKQKRVTANRLIETSGNAQSR